MLLVEDERAVRDLTEEMLRDLGYSVAAFGDPSEAEHYFDSDGGNVDLLLTDVVMPGISGVDLARRFTGGRPDLKVLFMSGYTDDQIADHGVLGAGVKLLPKPFGGADLARMVRRTLDFSNDLTE